MHPLIDDFDSVDYDIRNALWVAMRSGIGSQVINGTVVEKDQICPGALLYHPPIGETELPCSIEAHLLHGALKR